MSKGAAEKRRAKAASSKRSGSRSVTHEATRHWHRSDRIPGDRLLDNMFKRALIAAKTSGLDWSFASDEDLETLLLTIPCPPHDWTLLNPLEGDQQHAVSAWSVDMNAKVKLLESKGASCTVAEKLFESPVLEAVVGDSLAPNVCWGPGFERMLPCNLIYWPVAQPLVQYVFRIIEPRAIIMLLPQLATSVAHATANARACTRSALTQIDIALEDAAAASEEDQRAGYAPTALEDGSGVQLPNPDGSTFFTARDEDARRPKLVHFETVSWLCRQCVGAFCRLRRKNVPVTLDAVLGVQPMFLTTIAMLGLDLRMPPHLLNMEFVYRERGRPSTAAIAALINTSVDSAACITSAWLRKPSEARKEPDTGKGSDVKVVDLDGIPEATSCTYCRCGRSTCRPCSRCHGAYYCGTACQKSDWKRHKSTCVAADKAQSPASCALPSRSVHTVLCAVCLALTPLGRVPDVWNLLQSPEIDTKVMMNLLHVLDALGLTFNTEHPGTFVVGDDARDTLCEVDATSVVCRKPQATEATAPQVAFDPDEDLQMCIMRGQGVALGLVLALLSRFRRERVPTTDAHHAFLLRVLKRTLPTRALYARAVADAAANSTAFYVLLSSEEGIVNSYSFAALGYEGRGLEELYPERTVALDKRSLLPLARTSFLMLAEAVTRETKDAAAKNLRAMLLTIHPEDAVNALITFHEVGNPASRSYLYQMVQHCTTRSAAGVPRGNVQTQSNDENEAGEQQSEGKNPWLQPNVAALVFTPVFGVLKWTRGPNKHASEAFGGTPKPGVIDNVIAHADPLVSALNVLRFLVASGRGAMPKGYAGTLRKWLPKDRQKAGVGLPELMGVLQERLAIILDAARPSKDVLTLTQLELAVSLAEHIQELAQGLGAAHEC